MFHRLSLFSIFIFLISLSGCPVYDPPNPGPSHIYNCSNEAIYVYHSRNGRLEMEPRLELFEKKKKEFMFEDTGCGHLLVSPDYRVNAYEEKEVPNPYLKPGAPYTDSLFFFFITEKAMKNLSWEDLVKKQLYEKKISISMEAYNDLHRAITYTPKN